MKLFFTVLVSQFYTSYGINMTQGDMAKSDFMSKMEQNDRLGIRSFSSEHVQTPHVTI